MDKINLLLPMILSISIIFSACSKKKEIPVPDDKIIAASFYPMYIAAMNVIDSIPGIRLVNMTSPPPGCLHGYKLSQADSALIKKTAVMIVNGGGMETSLGDLASLNNDLIIINASDGIDFLCNDSERNYNFRDNDDDSRCVHNHGSDVNSHVWMNFDNYMHQIKNIAELLSVWDHGNAQLYHDNARNYINELKELQVSSNRRLSNLANRQIVISHDGFLYLAKEFGLVVTAIIEKTPGTEPDHADIVKTINIIRNEEPKAIFIDGSRPSQAAKTIFEHTGLHIFELDMAITGPPEKDAYIRAMEKNVSTLKGVLN